jgi:hypothetical protein
MQIQIYSNNLESSIKNNVVNFLNKKNIFQVIFDNLINVNSNYITNLVFPENNLSNSQIKNVWTNLSLRPFKVCPINKEKLYLVSNNSILNICVFNEFNKLIGFVVISENDDYWIEIFCTNIKQGIGNLIDNLIKLILISKPIRLQGTFNSEEFYIKKGFVVLNDHLMEYKKIETFI